MAAHASLLGPSSSARIIQCPGSVRLSKELEAEVGRSPGGFMACRGTCLHRLGERVLLGTADLDTSLGKTMVMVPDDGPAPYAGEADFLTDFPAGTPFEFEMVLTAEDIDSVATYVEAAELYAASAVEWSPEIKVDISESVALPGQFGTSDFQAVLPWTDPLTGENAYELVTLDYKSGRIAVDPQENSQGLLYALGALKVFAPKYDIRAIRIAICQPMVSRRVSEWVTTVDWLREWERDVAQPTGHRVLRLMSAPINEVHDSLRPSEKACEFCTYKSRCPALAGTAVSEVFGSVDDFTAPQPLAHIDIWRAFRLIPLIETWLDSLKAEVERLATAGQHDGSVKVVRGRSGARKWAEGREGAVAAMLETLLGDAAFMPRALQSPTQIEKALKKSAPDVWAIIAEDITTPLGRVQVVPVGDPREAIAQDEGAAPEGSTADFL